MVGQISKEQMRKLQNIFIYILKLLGGEEYSKTKLVKLLYLLDYETFKKKGNIFTGLTYKKYYYGPYSRTIEEVISSLKNKGAIMVLQRTGTSGRDYYVFKLVKDIETLDSKEKQEIQDRLESYLNETLDEILDDVYSTEPVQNTKFGQEILF